MALIDEVTITCDDIFGLPTGWIMMKRGRTVIGNARMWESADHYYLSCFGIYVAKYRGHGLGSVLLERSIGYARGKPIELQAAAACPGAQAWGSAPVLTQEQLVQFYERHGFHVISESRERCCRMRRDGNVPSV